MIIIASIFSAIIVLMTAYSLVKVLIIAYKRQEITIRKLILYSTISLTICITIASITPFFYGFLIELLDSI